MPQIVIATIESAFNRLLKLDPEAADKLAAMEGRVIGLEIRGLNSCLYLFPAPDDVMILDNYDAEPDTLISGTPVSLLRLGMAENAQAEMFEGDVTISGDLHLGNKFKRLLASLDIDWEELLAKAVGDMAARSLGNLARDLFSWQQRTTDSMFKNSGEYLQEEIQYLPGRYQAEAFYSDVDTLRARVDRLEARLKLLMQKKNNKAETK